MHGLHAAYCVLALSLKCLLSPGRSTSVTNIEDFPAGTGQTKQNDINSKLPIFAEGCEFKNGIEP
jgi:hypothetical protein